MNNVCKCIDKYMLSIHICIYYTYQYIIHVNINVYIYIYIKCGKWPNRIHKNESWGNKYVYIYIYNCIHMCIVSWFVWICMAKYIYIYKDERGATEDILCGDAFAGKTLISM